MRLLKGMFIICFGTLLFGVGGKAAALPKVGRAWTDAFTVEKGDWSSTGRNPYFILEPGYRLIMEGDGARLTITVTDQTRTVDGVETRVVEERETEDGELVEVSRNYFAVSRKTGAVYYFGEEVDFYKGGKVAGHDGSWLAGERGARFGLMMPDPIRVGERYYQEIAPGTAMDRAEIVGTNETIKTPAGEFKNCLKTEETTSLEPGNREYKFYAPGVGLVRDGDLILVQYGNAEAPKTP